MRSSIKLKNGDTWFLKYSYQSDHLLEIVPFQNEIYDKQIYLPDGNYELLNGGLMTIKSRNIDYIKWDNKDNTF